MGLKSCKMFWADRNHVLIMTTYIKDAMEQYWENTDKEFSDSFKN